MTFVCSYVLERRQLPELAAQTISLPINFRFLLLARLLRGFLRRRQYLLDQLCCCCSLTLMSTSLVSVTGCPCLQSFQNYYLGNHLPSHCANSLLCSGLSHFYPHLMNFLGQQLGRSHYYYYYSSWTTTLLRIVVAPASPPYSAILTPPCHLSEASDSRLPHSRCCAGRLN